jgi:hypothetical protein
MARFRLLHPAWGLLVTCGLQSCGVSPSTSRGGAANPNVSDVAVGTVQHGNADVSTAAVGTQPNLGDNDEVHDEHWFALQRMLAERWSKKPDRDEQLLVPLADSRNWKRVRFWLVDHFTGFRYGDDVNAVNVVLIQDVEPGVVPTADLCMKLAERWARPQMRSFDVRMGPVQSRKSEWRGSEVPVRAADALVDYGFGPMQFSAAWVAYPAYTNACLIFAFAVPWGEHRELAQQVRERWIEEGVRKIKPLTEVRPYRKPHDD